jgi:hypothetical protein
MGEIVADVSSGLGLTPPQEIKKLKKNCPRPGSSACQWHIMLVE